MNEASKCPVDQLDVLLDDHCSHQHSALLEHLETCSHCQRLLQELAAGEADWIAAREALFEDRVPNDLPGQQSNSEAPSDSTPRSHALSSLLHLLSPTDHPDSAGRIGSFEIVGIVGSGGMGVVLKARDPALDRFVAIKILAPHLASSDNGRKRFAREAKAAAAVLHDNVIPIYQVAQWQDLPYLVMPYLPDPSLGQRLEAEGKLELEAVLSVGTQIAKGLAAAHAQGLVHRDVKPANILLCQGTERAIITDFGLARASDDASLTRVGMLAGTPHYMSPEQARGEVVDQQSDLFSLGSVLFAMTTGEPPVNLELGSETIRQIASCKLPSLRDYDAHVPDWLARLVDWLHAPSPSRRPKSAAEVADLLEQCLAHLRQPDKTSLPEVLVARRFRGKRLAQSIGLSTLLVVVATFGVRNFTSNPSEEDQSPASKTSASSMIQTSPSRPSEATVPVQPAEAETIPAEHLEWDAPIQPLIELQDAVTDLRVRVEDGGQFPPE